jgi:methionyl aminopeptidase
MIAYPGLGTSLPNLSLCNTQLLFKKSYCPLPSLVWLFSLWPWRPPKRRTIPKFSIVIPEGKKVAADLSIIPGNIPRPPYINNEDIIPDEPVIWSHDQICKIRESCHVARNCLDFAGTLVEPGISTQDIDRQAREFIVARGAYPSPLGFKGFPKSISCSVNNVAAHGIPDSRRLEAGDIVNIDVTVYLDGYHGDCSWTYPVGEVDSQAADLIQVTTQCLDIGISVCKHNMTYRGIGQAIDKHCKANGFLSMQYLLGHGIGS